jgi:hypothetical protein
MDFDQAFAPGATPWEVLMRTMLDRRKDTRVSNLVGNESIMDWLKSLNRSDVKANDLIVASHATDMGVLFLDLDAVHSGEPATYEALEEVESSRTIEIPVGVRKATTRFHVKGCRIGSDDCIPYLTKLKSALGNPRQVTAPKFFHGLYNGSQGIFEWMGHSYELVVKDAFKKHADLVTAFQNKKFTRLDGIQVADADINRWVPRTLQLAPRVGTDKVAISVPVSIVPETGSLKAIANIGAQCRSERSIFTWVPGSAPVPPNTTELKKVLAQESKFQPPPTHPYPIYHRYHYSSFDEFFDGQTWVLTRSRQWIGTHFVYTLVIPVTKPSPPAKAINELIFNFYPPKGDPTMNFLEDDATLFGRV